MSAAPMPPSLRALARDAAERAPVVGTDAALAGLEETVVKLYGRRSGACEDGAEARR